MLHYIAKDNTLFNLKNKVCKIEKNHESEKSKKNLISGKGINLSLL
jgi:hypothetical protein